MGRRALECRGHVQWWFVSAELLLWPLLVVAGMAVAPDSSCRYTFGLFHWVFFFCVPSIAALYQGR